jgi:uncharacterized membrane-anchored protein YitT (DUF2179 family)
MIHKQPSGMSLASFASSFLRTAVGAFLAAFAIEVFLVPNQIIDGGVVGISILLSKWLGREWLYPFVLILNLPFLVLAYRNIGKRLVVQMCMALVLFSILGSWIAHSQWTIFQPFKGELLEVVVLGGLLLGLGVGLIIRAGGCLDGTEILGLLWNRTRGYSVGSVVFASNLLIFGAAGLWFQEWHPPLQSLITFFIVIKIMDMVIVGLDEMKSVMVFSTKPKEISDAILTELGLGLTVLHGSGGYSGEPRQVLYLIVERLQLIDIKNIVYRYDPRAFIAIENLHEVASNGMISIARKVQPAHPHRSSPR